MRKPLMMTPGPTAIHEDVRNALAEPITNPDLDIAFYDFYRETCEKLQTLLKTENEVLILCGEGILGLEAATASLVEPGDRVLCLDNGIFGRGFGDFVTMYGGEVTYFESDYQRAIDPADLERFLVENHDFKFATLVHCETPSGITNPVNQLCPILKRHGIITVVDSVSGMGGEEVKTDEWQMDIVLGGSQKCLSAPPGLTFLSISPAAWERIGQRKVPIVGFYANLSIWKDWYAKKWFPYTQPISDIYGLRVAVERLLADDAIGRHARIAEAVRNALQLAGLQLYPRSGFSNTVTAVHVPQGVTFPAIYETMLQKHNILIAGSFGFLENKVIRIGHMGENCAEEKVYLTLKALDQTLREHGVPLKGELHKLFVDQL